MPEFRLNMLLEAYMTLPEGVRRKVSTLLTERTTKSGAAKNPAVKDEFLFLLLSDLAEIVSWSKSPKHFIYLAWECHRA